MASLDLNVGSAANANDGATLRDAFINVRKMFAEIYGFSYPASDSDSIAGNSLAIKAASLSHTITPASGNDGYVLTYDHSSGGFTLEQKFDGDITGIVAGNGLTGTADSGDATLNVVGGDGITANTDEVEVTVDDSTIELSATDGNGAVRIKDLGVTTAHIADDNITHAKLEGRYTRVQDIATTTSTIDLECDDYAVFNLTGNLGTCTLNLKDLKTGQVVDVICSGSDLTSASITLSTNFTTVDISKVGTTDFNTAKKNHFVFSCIDDTDGDAIVNYTVNEYATDTDQGV